MKFELLNSNEFFENISMHIRPNQENAIWKMRVYTDVKKKEPVTLCWGDKQCTVSSSALSLIFRDYSVKLRILSSFCAYSPRIFVIHSRSCSVHIKFNHRFVPVPTISPSKYSRFFSLFGRCCCCHTFVIPNELCCRIWFFKQEMNDVNE